MARPKPTVPVDVPFYARTTKGERAAIEALLAKRTARVREVEPTAPALDLVGWFRGLVHREAKEEGVAIVEPEAPAAKSSATRSASPAKPKPKAARK